MSSINDSGSIDWRAYLTTKRIFALHRARLSQD
jgi:hypothetical protein